MKISVGVDAGRSRLGRMEVDSAQGTGLRPVDVCATADPVAARAAGNPAADPLRPGGHAPFGTYVLKQVRRVAGALMRDWGEFTIVFEPQSGQAREAESYGRLVLALHGGDPGDDGRLRTTSLGLRVDRQTLEQVAAAADRGERVELDIHEVPVGFWDRIFFWRRRPSRGFFAADPTTPTDRDDWNSTSSSPRGDDFAGKGGQFGGGGASASWDAPRGAGGAAAGAAALGAGVIAASELGLGGDREAPGESSGSAGSDGGASDAPASESSGSETSTSY